MQLEPPDDMTEKKLSLAEEIQAQALELEIAARTLEGAMAPDLMSPLASSIAQAIAASLHRSAQRLILLLPALDRKAAPPIAAARRALPPPPRRLPVKPAAVAKPQRPNGADKPAPAPAEAPAKATPA
jgi:hypothetical protein